MAPLVENPPNFQMNRRTWNKSHLIFCNLAKLLHSFPVSIFQAFTSASDVCFTGFYSEMLLESAHVLLMDLADVQPSHFPPWWSAVCWECVLGHWPDAWWASSQLEWMHLAVGRQTECFCRLMNLAPPSWAPWSIKTSELFPEAAMQGHAMTLPPPCLMICGLRIVIMSRSFFPHCTLC